MRNAPGNTGTHALVSSIISMLNTWMTAASQAIVGNAQPASVLRLGEMDMNSRNTCGTTIGNEKAMDSLANFLGWSIHHLSNCLLVKI